MFNITPLRQEDTRRKKTSKKIKSSQILGMPYYFLLVFLIIIPLLLIMFYAFTVQENGLFHKFTFDYFRQFFSERIYIKILLNSIWLAVLTTVISLVIGFPTSYVITKLKPRRQSLIILLITAPMWINMLILTEAWQQLFEMFMGVGDFSRDFISRFGLGSDFAIVVGMVNIFLPFMIIPIYTVLSKIDPLLYEASSDLGAGSIKTFFKVTLPLSLGGVMSGITMVLLPAATTIVIPKKLGRGKYMIGTLIEDKFFHASNLGQGAAIGIILALIIMLMMFLTRKLDKTKLVDKDENEEI